MNAPGLNFFLTETYGRIRYAHFKRPSVRCYPGMGLIYRVPASVFVANSIFYVELFTKGCYKKAQAVDLIAICIEYDTHEIIYADGIAACKLGRDAVFFFAEKSSK